MNKKFDCVEMKHRAARIIQKKYQNYPEKKN